MISLLVTLIILCLIGYLVQSLLPGPAPLKNIIIIVLVVFAILYLFEAIGFMDVPMPRMRHG